MRHDVAGLVADVGAREAADVQRGEEEAFLQGSTAFAAREAELREEGLVDVGHGGERGMINGLKKKLAFADASLCQKTAGHKMKSKSTST